MPTGTENSFGYDLLGDMTSKADVGTYSFPAAGQAHPHGVASIAMAGGGTTTLAYDYDGQLTSETGPITRTIGWTLFNKVASTAYAGLSTQFNYDADENVVDFVASGATVVTLPDGVVVTNGALRNWLIYAKVDGLKTVEFTGPTGALKHEYLHHDDQGSTMVVTDDTFNPATAQPQFSNAGYDAYGQPRSQNGAATSTWGSAQGYIDQRMMKQSQLINLNARFYDPQVGEFLSPDPIIGDEGDSQAWNGYSYSGDNPMSHEDPSGLDDAYQTPGLGSRIGDSSSSGPADGVSCSGDCNGKGDLAPGEGRGGGYHLGETYTSNVINNPSTGELSGVVFPQATLLPDSYAASSGYGSGAAGISVAGIYYSGMSGSAGRPGSPYPVKLGCPVCVREYLRQAGAGNMAASLGGLFKIDILAILGALAGAEAAVVEAAEEVGLNGTALARSLGQAGEDAVGITGPKLRIEIPGSGQIRVPDALTESALTEVKNVGSLSYTQQIRDFVTYSQANGLDFQLYVRPSTQLSGPLQQAITNGQINLNFIPGAP